MSERTDPARVDAELEALAEGAFGFLERLVAEVPWRAERHRATIAIGWKSRSIV